MKLSEIYEGWKNKLFPAQELKEIINRVSEERMVICNSCDLISTKHDSIRPDIHCTNCGCTLSAKTKCLSCKCPLDKWGSLMSLEEENEIKSKDKLEGYVRVQK